MLRVAVALAVLVLVTAAEAQSPPLAVARFYELETAHTSLGSFQGATESWRGQIVLLRSRKAVGASYTSCIRVSPTVRNCYATYALPQGTMAAQGIVGNQDRYSLSIVGGTGAYLGNQGWLSVNGIGANPRQGVGPNGQLAVLRFSSLVFHLRQL